MKKLLTLVIAIVMLFAVTTSSLATVDDYTYLHVIGGPSNSYFYGHRDEPNTLDMHVSYLNMNGQSNLLFRGWYENSDGILTTCTYSKQITTTGYRGATYLTSNAQYVYVYMSIASSSSSNYAVISGTYAI